MDYTQKPQFHYKPRRGWVNDPNGLVYFNGYYHIFYQHAPDFEVPWKQPMHWGHARTQNWIDWEELPVALYPDREYDGGGCWSGTAAVKDGRLYLFYASVHAETGAQTVSVAFSDDGVHFEKYAGNPVIDRYPPDGGPDFRDPAICQIGGQYCCIMATGHRESESARLLLYRSDDLLHWEYDGILCTWDGCRYAECPSLLMAEQDLFLLAASVCPLHEPHYFSVMYGVIREGKFIPAVSSEVDRGPDQYAGQLFRDPQGRNLQISWIPGWDYQGYAEKDVGCMSVPREFRLTDGKICGYPPKELRHLLKDEDPAICRTETGFIIRRTGREPVVYEGAIRDLKILRDGFVLEVFVNGGEEIYTALL